MITVHNLKKYFQKRKFFLKTKDEPVRAVDGVSFKIEKGKTFGLVGESGSGKSTIAKLLTGIISKDSGEIYLKGDIDIVFQDPFSSLNPRMTVRKIVGESLYIRKVEKKTLDKKIKDTLKLVQLEPFYCLNRYPHEFSGGERQRIAIARSLIRHPEILVLDEPVSSLDVSIQAGILNLLKDLQQEYNLTYLFISHDLRVVEFMSDFVGVMHSGKLVEVASSINIYNSPKSDYTKKLLEAIPKI